MFRGLRFGLPLAMLLPITLAIVFPVAFNIFPAHAQGETVAGAIINPLSGNSDFAFNSTVYPVNSTFTVDFYVKDVTDLIAWQIKLTWNTSIINFTNVWIPGVPPYPGTNVFTPAFNKGATPLPTDPIVDISEGTNTGYLWYALAVLYTDPAHHNYYPVTVTGQALLCRMNFTILTSAAGTDTVNGTIKNLDFSSGFDQYSCVFIYSNVEPYNERVQMIAQPATVEIYGPDAKIPEYGLLILASLFVAATLLAAVASWKRKQHGRTG
jgi:hypothetical protein